jgi:thioredoxin 1
MKNTVEVTEDSFESLVSQANTPVLVDFHAPWCGPCLMLAPLLEQLAAEFDGRVKFTKVNVDNAPALAERFGITGVPTLILFRGGKPAGRTVGLASPRQLRGWLQSLVAENVPAA